MGTSDPKSPAQLRTERFASLRAEWNQLSGRVTLGQLNDGIEDTHSRIEALPGQVKSFRSRGYLYSAGWEARAEMMRKGWPERKLEARRILQEQARRLEDLVKGVEALCARTTLSDAELDRLDSQLDQLKTRLQSAENSVRGAYDSLAAQLQGLQGEFRSVEFLLDSLDSASFDLYPDEHGVAACEAIWTEGRDEFKGILFLMAGRLIFEQREKKATKKVLFVTTASELVQEKLWEAPIGAIAELEAEDERKFLAKKELLRLRFREPPARLSAETTVRLKDARNEEWLSLLNRVQSGEIEKDRYDLAKAGGDQPASAAPPAPAKEIPTKCPACGAKLPTVVKGMQVLTCGYCGSEVRL